MTKLGLHAIAEVEARQYCEVARAPLGVHRRVQGKDIFVNIDICDSDTRRQDERI